MTLRHQAGRATGTFVLLLLVFSVAGGWNYYRNWQVEKASEAGRPYRNYAVGDLESLRAAYASELTRVRQDFDSAKRQRAQPVGDRGSIASNVAQFQRATRSSSAIREAAAGVAEREGQIEELDRELTIRSQFGQGFARHLKRLTTI